MGKQYDYEYPKDNNDSKNKKPDKFTQDIKRKITNLRNNEGLHCSQAQLAVALGLSEESKSTIAKWENLSSFSLPNIKQMVQLCNFFDVDINHLLGKTSIKSEDNYVIADALNLTVETVGILKKNPEYGTFIDNILADRELYDEIVKRTSQLGRASILADVINTSFTESFLKKLYNIFNDFYNNTFPMDVSAVNFEKFLCNKISYYKDFNSINFFEDKFTEDGKCFILNKFFPDEENQYAAFCKTDSRERYKMIMSSVVDICYDYFMSEKIVELSKHRLSEKILGMVDDIIKGEKDKMIEKLKRKE